MEQNTESLLQDASLPGRGAGKDEDPYVSEDDTDDEDSLEALMDEVDAPLASLEKYCNAFMEKYGSRRLAKSLRKASNSVSTPTTKTDDDKDEYDFSHKRRGLAVIINNVKYQTEDGKVDKREGSKRDASKLEKTFRHLGFDVKRYNDLTRNQMLLKLQKVASNKKYDHSLADCFACAILAHGWQETMLEPRNPQYDALERHDVVYGVDWKEVHTAYLTSIFNDECCPGLQGKPRLFIIQACRGKDLDVGHEITVLKTQKTKKCFRKHGSGKGHDARDAISSDSDSDSDSDSESGPDLELASDLELMPDQEHGEEAEEEPMKVQETPCKHEMEEIQQTTEIHEQSTEIKLNKHIDEKKKTEQELDPMEDMEANCEGRKGSEQMTKGTEKGKKQEQGTMQRTDEVQIKQLTKNTSARDTGGPIFPSSSKSNAVSKRKELIVSPPPIYKDFLLVYAAPPGYFAWRNKKDGGWLIQALKNVLMTKDAFRDSFSRLLTRVSWKVAKNFKSLHSDQDLNERKLVPCVMSMLTKDIYFRKK